MRRLWQMSVCEASARISEWPNRDLPRRKKFNFVEKRRRSSPLPRFLEVLILKDFKSLFPEVLIPGDFKSFAPEVLILVDLKSCGMSEIRRFAKFPEVLILRGLEAKKGCPE